MQRNHSVVIGAGIGGLVCALELARKGHAVTLLESAAAVGGKMRQAEISGQMIDVGPTVLTMKWVFDKIFSDAGSSFDDALSPTPLSCLARHAWDGRGHFDLSADLNKTIDDIGRFFSKADAAGYRDFCLRARATYQTLEGSFIRSSRPTPISLTANAGLKGIGDLWRISPFATLWRALGDHFHDPRLRQLFARYATYCGSSPYQCPATLMLVAHVEQEGVWTLPGGMKRLGNALASLASATGVTIRTSSSVREIRVHRGKASGVTLASGEVIEADRIVCNADPAALTTGLFGRDAATAIAKVPPGARSLSAVTFAMLAKTRGFPLTRHNVVFGRNYEREFDDIFTRRTLPRDPTIYICAEDRRDANDAAPSAPERLFFLINAPANGDTHDFRAEEIERCRTQMITRLAEIGLEVSLSDPQALVTSTPKTFAQLFPATGGALYGQASHGWTASFSRPEARTKIPGLYLAGGSVHPGPGVPMAAISGWLAAATLHLDQTSPGRSASVVMPGGTSTL